MTNDMTKGAITPLLIRFTIPLVLGNLFQLTYNAADSIIVGKFVGEDALAAVGTSNPLMTLAILFINGMCLGAGILVSTAFGAGDTRLVERQVSTTAIAGTVFSLVFSALCVILATPLLQLMQVPADILPIAVSYLRIVFAGLIFTFFYNFLAATMRALGDSKRPLYFLLVASFLNIGLDLVCIIMFHMGAFGAAFATVVSQAVAGLVALDGGDGAGTELAVGGEPLALGVELLLHQTHCAAGRAAAQGNAGVGHMQAVLGRVAGVEHVPCVRAYLAVHIHLVFQLELLHGVLGGNTEFSVGLQLTVPCAGVAHTVEPCLHKSHVRPGGAALEQRIISRDRHSG